VRRDLYVLHNRQGEEMVEKEAAHEGSKDATNICNAFRAAAQKKRKAASSGRCSLVSLFGEEAEGFRSILFRNV